MKMTKEALDKSSLGKYLPTNMPKADKTDGNCVSSNEPKHFSGHQHQFRSGQGSVKAWLGQNYKDLKRQSKRSGMLFEDPEFPASNHLLTDDNQTLIFLMCHRQFLSFSYLCHLEFHIALKRLESKKISS